MTRWSRRPFGTARRFAYTSSCSRWDIVELSNGRYRLIDTDANPGPVSAGDFDSLDAAKRHAAKAP